MRLVRNTTLDGKCKYALVRLDKIRLNETGEQFSTDCDPAAIQDALDLLHREGLLEYGEKGSKEEFFAIKLKDRFSHHAFEAYATAVANEADILVMREGLDEKDVSGLREYATDVSELAERAEERTDATTPD